MLLPCSEQQMEALTSCLSRPEAFGPVSAWRPEIFSEIGTLAGMVEHIIPEGVNFLCWDLLKRVSLCFCFWLRMAALRWIGSIKMIPEDFRFEGWGKKGFLGFSWDLKRETLIIWALCLSVSSGPAWYCAVSSAARTGGGTHPWSCRPDGSQKNSREFYLSFKVVGSFWPPSSVLMGST